MSSPLDCALDQSFSFRKDSNGEDLSDIDLELVEVVEKLKESSPHCDRLSQINALITHCRQRLRDTVELNENCMKQLYLDRFVQLNLEKQNLEESDETRSAAIKIRGHDFELQSPSGRSNPCCEVCMHTIWRLVQSWRRCTVCGIRSHDKCVSAIQRQCAAITFAHRDFVLQINFPEEKGLAKQNYRCAECYHSLSYEGAAHMEPRLCEYTGLLFCPSCHWGDQLSIPARLVHNMESAPRPVCRAVKQLLLYINGKPLVNMNVESPALFKYHKDLRRVSQLRKNFLFMKCYFICCKAARKLRILQYLNRHQHFVENSDVYSIGEIRDLCDGKLLPELEEIHTVFRKHIEEECETCQGNGFFCELCTNNSVIANELLFPFSEGISVCQSCLAVYHSKCFEKHSFHCARCERRRRRAPAENEYVEEISTQRKN